MCQYFSINDFIFIYIDKNIMEEIVKEIQEETFSNGQKFKQLFKFIKIIGEGAFGLVIQVQRQLGDELANRALKIIQKSKVPQYAFETIRNEAEILQQLQVKFQRSQESDAESRTNLNDTRNGHPNIVQFYQLYETEQFGIIEMEYVPNGTLGNLIKHFRVMAQTQQIPYDHDYQVSQIMMQLIQAVQVVHKNDFVHRDIKPENILCSQGLHNKEQIDIKLADFGLAAHFKVSLSQKDQLMERAGTFKYMAPEQAFQGKIYGKKIDMWACGIIMYKLLSCGDHPIAPRKVTEKDFTQLLRDPKWQFPEQFTEYAIDFFLKLCDQSPTNRYTAQQALQHPWINRNFISSPIPKTQLEEIKDQSAHQNLKQAVNFALLTQILKGPQSDLVKAKGFIDYKQRCQDFILRPQSRSPNLNDSLSHSINKYRLSSEQTVISPSGAKESIMSSPRSRSSSPKKGEKFKGIKFTIENTENEPATPRSILSQGKSPRMASGVDPKMLIFKDERQFQTIKENMNDDNVGDTQKHQLKNFDSQNQKLKASLPPQIQNIKKRVVNRLVPVTSDPSNLNSFDNRKSPNLQTESNHILEPISNSPGQSETVGNLVDYIMPQLDIDIIDPQFDPQNNQISLLIQKPIPINNSKKKSQKSSKLQSPYNEKDLDLEHAVESNYDQYVKAVHTLKKDQYKTKMGASLVDASVKQDRQHIFLVPGVFSKNAQLPEAEQIGQVYLQDKKILVKNNSQDKLSPVHSTSKHSKKRSATVVKRRGSQPPETVKNLQLALPEINKKLSLNKSRSKKSIKQKSPKMKHNKKSSNQSFDQSEEDIYEGYDKKNNIINLKLNSNFTGKPKNAKVLIRGSPKRQELSLPSINSSAINSPFLKGRGSPLQRSQLSSNIFPQRRTSAISEIIQGGQQLDDDQMHLNKVYHNITKLRIQMDQQLEKQENAKFGFQREEITPQNMNFKYLGYISPQYKDLISMIKQRHQDREILRSKLQQQERRLLVGTDREGFGSMSQSPTHRHKKLISDKDGVKKMQSQLDRIKLKMEAKNLGLDGTSIDNNCINEVVDKIAALGIPIDSEMMRLSNLKPSEQNTSPRSTSPHNSVISYEQFIEEIQNFLRDQAIGNPSPLNQQILQLKDNQILMLAKNLVENTNYQKVDNNSPFISLNHTGPIDQGVGVVTESFSQQLRNSGHNVTKASGTHTLQLNNSKVVSRASREHIPPIVSVQRLQRQAALEKKKYGAITHTITQESDDEINAYNPNVRPTSTKLGVLNQNALMLQETLESPKSGTVQNNTTSLNSRVDLKSPRNLDMNDQQLMTEITEAVNKSSIIDGTTPRSPQMHPRSIVEGEFSPLKNPYQKLSQETSRVKNQKEVQILLNDEQKIFESPHPNQRKVVNSDKKNIHVQFQSASQSIERSLTHGAHYSRLRQRHIYPSNADLQEMRESLSQEKVHYTKFDPSSLTPKVSQKEFKNYQELRQEQDKLDKLILSNHQVDARTYQIQARKNLEKKQQYLEQMRQDQKVREAKEYPNSRVQFEFQHGVSQAYAPILKTQALGQVLITDEDFEEFSPLNNPITLAQPSHVGPSVEVTVSKAISVYESTHDEPSQTPLQPSHSRDQMLTIPKASTNSLSISDAAILQFKKDQNRGGQQNKQPIPKQSADNSRSQHVSQEMKHRKVLNIDHEMRKMMQENKKLEHHVDVRASVSDSIGQQDNQTPLNSKFQIVHQVINDYTKKIDSSGTHVTRGVNKNLSLMSQGRFGDISYNNANTQDIDYSHYGSPTSPMETPGHMERHVRISTQNQQWKQNQRLSTINDVQHKPTELTLDHEQDQKSLELIDQNEEILIEEGELSSNGDKSKTPIVMMESPDGSVRNRSPREILRPMKSPTRRSNEDLILVNAGGSQRHIHMVKLQNPSPHSINQSSQMSHIQVTHKSKHQIAQGTQMAQPTVTNFLTKWEHLSEAKGDTRMIAQYKNSQGEVVSNRTMSNIEPNEQTALQAMIEMDQTKRPFDHMTLETDPNVKIVRKIKSPKRGIVDLNMKSNPEKFRNSKSNSRSTDLKLFETEQSKFDPLSPSSAMLREQLNIFEQRKQHLTVIKNQLNQQNAGQQINIMKIDNELLDFSENLRMPSNNVASNAHLNMLGRNHPLTFGPKKLSLKQSQKSNYNSSQRENKSHSALGLIGVGTQVQVQQSRRASQLSLASYGDKASDHRKILEQQIHQDIIFGIDGSQYEEYLARNKVPVESQQLMPSRMKNISQIKNISAIPHPNVVQRTGFTNKNTPMGKYNLSGQYQIRDNKRSTIQMQSPVSNGTNIKNSINYIPKHAGRMEKTQVGSW